MNGMIFHGIKVFQSDMLEDDQAVTLLGPPAKIYLGQLIFLQVAWEIGRRIDDFIEWRCAYYSRAIDKKHYLA